MTEQSQTALLRNIRIGFGICLLLLIISSFASFRSIVNLLDSFHDVDHTDSVIERVSSTLSALKDAETGQRGYLLTGDTAFLQPYHGSREKALGMIDQIGEMTADNPVQQANVVQLREVVTNRLDMLQGMIDQKREDNIFSVQQLREGKASMDQARIIVARMEKEEHELLARRIDNVRKYSAYSPVLITIAALLSVLTTLFFYRRVSQDFRERLSLYRALREKDLDTERRIGIIGGIADKISAGDYRTRVTDEQRDGLGEIAGSLNKMAASLEYSFGLLSDKEWMQAGLARLNEIMLGETEMPRLAANIIEFIAGYTGSQTGALYVIDNKGRLLERKGAFALAATEDRALIPLGEGLAGQVALDGRRVVLRDIPATGWTLSLASGDIRPTTIVAFPIYFERQTRGVIELGSLTPYSARDLEFLYSLEENIGAAINSVETRIRLQDLLEQTQAQSEELQTQHAELESLNMELEMQAEKLQASEEELRVQQEELLTSNRELEEKSQSLQEKNDLVLMRNLEIRKKAEELEISTRYKSEFLANMSHELRTPLNSILLLSRLLQENKQENLTTDEMEYARVIQQSGQGLLQLIDEILDLSRIESGKLEPELSAVSIGEIVDDMQSLFTPMAMDKGLDLRFEIGEGAPAQLETDKLRLEQILRNLLSNALKFTPAGSVTLRIEPGREGGEGVNFIVSDTGIGIPADKHQLIFEAFRQADGSTRRKYGGTGLGLSISRELARLLGGSIMLLSKPDEGSRFTLSLPVRMQQAGPVKEEMPPIQYPVGAPKLTLTEIPVDIEDDRWGIEPGDKLLLIVEDDPHFGMALMEFGRRKGYKVIVAVRGDAAVDLARRFRPIGILLDIQLPVMNGWEVMDELKRDADTRMIPIHIISSFELKNESLLKGAIDFIHKPVSPVQMDDIFGRIEVALNRSPRKVMIVEDDEKHAQALAYYLASHEIRAGVAGSIAESAAMLKGTDSDVTILNLGSGGADIFGTLAGISKDPYLADIPVIVFLGQATSQEEEMRLREHANSLIIRTANSYERILNEVSLFLHTVDEEKEISRKAVFGKLGALDEVLKGKTVLVADDDVRNIYSLTRALETHKMLVLSAMDGREALAVMQKGDAVVDIVLMDMMMPEMDGYEAIGAIRALPEYSQIPIIAVTAKAMKADREKCIKAGASDYISKPVDIDQLLSLLRIWLYEK